MSSLNRARPRLVPTVVLLLAVASSARLWGQDRVDPIAAGKARASVASARGLGAVVSNPGGLGLRRTDGFLLDHPWTISLYNVGGSIGSTFLSSSEFNQIFGRTEGWPSQEDRRRLGTLLRDERLFANVANNLITACYRTPSSGTFGFHYGHRLYSRLNFPEDFTTVLANGELFNTQYEFVNRGIGGSWLTEFGLSYGYGFTTEATWFPTVGLGATVKFIRGVGQFELSDNSIMRVDRVTAGGGFGFQIRGGYLVRSAEPDGFDITSAVGAFASGLFPATAGSGFGADVGLSGVLYRDRTIGRDIVFFGVSVSDIGSVTWSKNTLQRVQTGINDILPNAVLNDEQFRRYQGTLSSIPDYSTATPSSVRAGLSLDVGALTEAKDDRLTVDIEGELALNDVPGNPEPPRVSVGADWGVNDWLQLRGGLRGGSIGDFGIGLGVGIRAGERVTVDIGTSEINAILAGERIDFALRVAVGLGE